MGLTGLVASVRDHYVKQFVELVEEQKRSWTKSGSEPALLFDEPSEFYRCLCRMDFIYEKSDGTIQRAQFDFPDTRNFEAISTSFGGASLIVQDLRWDHVVIHHDVGVLPQDKIDQWFLLWLDLDHKRHDPAAAASGVLHWMLIEPALVSLDFGTAPPEAFWEFLEILESAGASALWITSSIDQATPV